MIDEEKPKVHEPEGEETLIVEISRSLPLSQLTRGWKPQERQALNRNEPEALGALYDALLRETLKAPDNVAGIAFKVNNQTATGPTDMAGRED
jgi:hypothetical protein